jgi:hypothetical protein
MIFIFFYSNNGMGKGHLYDSCFENFFFYDLGAKMQLVEVYIAG